MSKDYELDKVRELLRFIINNKINIINLGISDIDIKELYKLVNCSNALLKEYLKEYRRKKIATESGFAAVILMLQLKLYVNFYLEREERINVSFRNLSEDKKDKIKSNAFGILLSDNFEESLKELESIFKKVLQKAYAIENKKSKRWIKSVFNNILYTKCETFTLFLKFFIDNYKNVKFSDSELYKKFK